jgi:serine/threonine protein kinase
MTETIVTTRPMPRRNLPSGTILNDTFVIENFIAAGGMGEVYRAKMITTGASVAIKLIKQEYLENEDVNALFLREASALDSLAHDAIVRYYISAIDRTLNRPYLAMEFVEGPSLSAVLAQRKLAFEEVDSLRKRLAEGLQSAHSRNIVHRDIAPDNVILADGDLNRAKLIDFGIAKSNNLSVKSVIQDGFAGKYNYASPEQFGLFKRKTTQPGDTGSTSNVSALSDIYSLGLVIAECLLGKPINMGSDFADAVDSRRAVPDLSGIDERLRPLLSQMLQPRPEDRIASMAEVAAWTSAPAKASSQTSKSSLAPIAAGLLLAIISGGAGFWYFTGSSAPPAPKVAAQPDSPVIRIANYTRYYDSDDCLLLQPIAISETSANIQALAASPAAAKNFEADFRYVNGFPASVSTVNLTRQQCDFVNFVHRIDSAPADSLKATLSKPVYTANENVSMRIDGTNAKHLELLAVGTDGSVRNLTHLVNRSGNQLVFDGSVSSTNVKGPRQDVLLGIVTPERLEISAAFAQGVASGAIFSSLASEIERKRIEPQIFFSVVQYR